MKAGDKVRFTRMPDWVDTMPEESQSVFSACLGKVFTISDIDENGLYVLDVSNEIDARFGGYMNDIRLESDYLDKI